MARIPLDATAPPTPRRDVGLSRTAMPPMERGRSRILVVGPTPPPLHGVAVVTRNLLESELAQRYDLVHVDTRDGRGVANIGRLDAGNVWRAGLHAGRFLSALLRSRPDAVYMPVAQNTLGFLRDALFMGVALPAGVPLILHFHGGGFDRFHAAAGPSVRALVRATVGRAERVIVLGKALSGMLAAVVPPGRVRVVPNGVADAGPATGGGDGKSLRVLFIGNLRPDKGYIDLLEAGRRLLEGGASLTLTFVGGVSDPAAHGEALRRLGPVPEGIRFTGALDAAARDVMLRSSDVLVLPSRDEAHPLVVLEAMSAGLPVIATRHSTLPETVLEGETGLLVEPRRPDQIADALEKLQDRALQRRLGAAGRARYLEEYTLDRWRGRMAAVFDEVLDARRAP
jgi:glycosyltransferase involved in cell wall biosynthesis